MSLENHYMSPGREIFEVKYWDVEREKIMYKEYEDEDVAHRNAESLVAEGFAEYAHVRKAIYLNSYDRTINVNKRFDDEGNRIR